MMSIRTEKECSEIWNSRLDEIKRKFDIANDSKLGEMLGLSKGAIHQFRRGETELGELSRLLVLENLDCKWASIAIDELISEKHRDRINNSRKMFGNNSKEPTFADLY